MKKIILVLIGLVTTGFFLIQENSVKNNSIGPENGPKQGYIVNSEGQKCWYDQTIKEDNTYFHKSMKGTNGVIKFKDPTCMSDNSTNKMMINNVISRWYSHSDANFQTRESELYDGSMMQINGKCIQSQKYPSIGIMVDYYTEDNKITGLIHGSSIQGCTNE